MRVYMPVGLFGAFGANVVFMRVCSDFTRGFFGARTGLKWGEPVLGQYEDPLDPSLGKVLRAGREGESAGCRGRGLYLKIFAEFT